MTLQPIELPSQGCRVHFKTFFLMCPPPRTCPDVPGTSVYKGQGTISLRKWLYVTHTAQHTVGLMMGMPFSFSSPRADHNFQMTQRKR